MSDALLRKPELYALLLRIDMDLAADARSAGCQRCCGRLDSATYPRKPRGGPPGVEADPAHMVRLSLCCDVCRNRVTPPSVRFFGRRLYFAPAFLLISALRSKLSARRLSALRERFGVDRRTVHRWQRWWRDVFPSTAFWRVQRGRVFPPVSEATFPQSLLERFAGAGCAQLAAALRFLSPLTTTSMVAE